MNAILSFSSVRLLVFLSVFCLLLTGLWLPATSNAAETEVQIRDFTNRGFVPDLVLYSLDAFHGKSWRNLHLFRADGSEKPIQFYFPGGDRKKTPFLCFSASVKPGATTSWTLRNHGAWFRPKGEVKHKKSADSLLLSNSLYAIRVPRPARRVFNAPVPASSLPAPILAFCGRNGKWLGAGHILSRRKVAEWQVRLTASGSVFVEVAYRIKWAQGGYYRARIRVIEQVPLVKIREDYDLGHLDGSDFWELDLTRGWAPDQAEIATTNGNGSVDRGRVIPLGQLLNKQPIRYLVGDHAWGQLLSHLGLFQKAERKNAPDTWTLASVIPLRKGDWRRSNALQIVEPKPGDIRIRFPMSARRADWIRDITSDTSPFSTQEYDNAYPLTYGRRVWGLALAPPAFGKDKTHPSYELRRFYGIFGLNRYKNFILQWPEKNKISYPRLYRRPGDVQAWDQAIAKSPDFKQLKKQYYLTGGGDKAAVANLKACLGGLRKLCHFYFISPTASHHATAGNYRLAALTDNVLAWPKLSDKDRQEIRSRLALLLYIYEDGDMMSYGNGHHHGNPNMGTARFWSGTAFLPLLPDHPMFKLWRKHMAAYAAYNLGIFVAPGGGYFEFGAAYHMHGFSRATNSLPGLAAAGAPHINELYQNYVIPDWTYFMNLLTPLDSRWKSRMLPGMANSPPGNVSHFFEAAASIRPYAPKLAANLLWAWQENGRSFHDANPLIAPASLVPKRPKLTSRIFPGVGAVFRAHQGPRETWMLFRSGFQWSHWYVDPGHFILYSRGASLVPFQPYQYAAPSAPDFSAYNTIRFGDSTNNWPHGWGDCNIIQHAFGARVDYVRSVTGFPDWFIDPGISPEWKNAACITRAGKRKLDPEFDQQQGPVDWTRQIIFLKGKTAEAPNYFVIHDSVSGDGKLASYLNLNLLGDQMNIHFSGQNLRADTQWPVGLNAFFVTPKRLTHQDHKERFRLALHDCNIQNRVTNAATASPYWIKPDGSPWEGRLRVQTLEKHLLIRIPSPPGTGYFWVLYPRTQTEPMPKVTTIGKNALKITHPAGTDYVFLSTTPQKYENGSVLFQGCAGAVRISPKTVTLAVSDGPGTAAYRQHRLTTITSAEKEYPLNIATATDTVPPVATPIQLPQPVVNAKIIAPGVTRTKLADGAIRYRLASDAWHRFRNEQLQIQGRDAVIEVRDDTVRFIAGVASGYVKLLIGNRGIRGVGPFDLTFSPKRIRGQVDGDIRSFAVSWPDGITRPQFRLDGIRYCLGWADDHSIGKTPDRPQLSIGFGVTAGFHRLLITEATFPPMPPNPAPRRLPPLDQAH